MQLVPREYFLQGSTKAPAQRLIQGFGAAQADNNLTFGAVQFHTLHKNVAESGTELLVCRKLRPDLGYKWFQSDSFADGKNGGVFISSGNGYRGLCGYTGLF